MYDANLLYVQLSDLYFCLKATRWIVQMEGSCRIFQPYTIRSFVQYRATRISGKKLLLWIGTSQLNMGTTFCLLCGQWTSVPVVCKRSDRQKKERMKHTNKQTMKPKKKQKMI